MNPASAASAGTRRMPGDECKVAVAVKNPGKFNTRYSTLECHVQPIKA